MGPKKNTPEPIFYSHPLIVSHILKKLFVNTFREWAKGKEGRVYPRAKGGSSNSWIPGFRSSTSTDAAGYSDAQRFSFNAACLTIFELIVDEGRPLSIPQIDEFLEELLKDGNFCQIIADLERDLGKHNEKTVQSIRDRVCVLLRKHFPGDIAQEIGEDLPAQTTRPVPLSEIKEKRELDGSPSENFLPASSPTSSVGSSASTLAKGEGRFFLDDISAQHVLKHLCNTMQMLNKGNGFESRIQLLDSTASVVFDQLRSLDLLDHRWTKVLGQNIALREVDYVNQHDTNFDPVACFLTRAGLILAYHHVKSQANIGFGLVKEAASYFIGEHHSFPFQELVKHLNGTRIEHIENILRQMYGELRLFEILPEETWKELYGLTKDVSRQQHHAGILARYHELLYRDANIPNVSLPIATYLKRKENRQPWPMHQPEAASGSSEMRSAYKARFAEKVYRKHFVFGAASSSSVPTSVDDRFETQSEYRDVFDDWETAEAVVGGIVPDDKTTTPQRELEQETRESQEEAAQSASKAHAANASGSEPRLSDRCSYIT